MLSELKIISQEGCLCETEVQETETWMGPVRACEASCLGTKPDGQADESAPIHAYTHTHTHRFFFCCTTRSIDRYCLSKYKRTEMKD